MFGKKTFVAVLVLILAYCYNAYINRKLLGPVIETDLGKIQGIESVSRGGKQFFEYLKIPYAKPPTGDLRFESPQPAEKWDGVRDGSKYGPECAQLKLITGALGGEEDCLFLNVFVPKDHLPGPLPVMVFIHGGAFITGSSNSYKGKYFMDQDVILVTINYRLAALGFLNTGDGIVKGNMGLKDQQAALKWVQKNIANFGGDTGRVTLFGESAGSASVGLHILSKNSKGLFSSAIMQSGAPTSNWSVFKEPAKQAKRFARKFNCPTDATTQEMVKCLKKVDTMVLIKAHEEVLIPLREPITIFVPTLEIQKDEDAFITEEPIKILESGNFNKVNLIIGVNSDEGLLTSAVVTSNQTKLDQANNDYHFWAARILNYPQSKTDVSDKIRKFYFGDVKSIANPDLIQNYTNLFSDRSFFVPTHRFAKYYSKQMPLRLYDFAYRVNVICDVAYRWFKTNVLRMTVPSPGVCHADELPYFFDWPLSQELNIGSRDYEISVDVVKTWTSFAKEETSIKFRGVEWTPMTSTQNKFKYLKIAETPAMIDEPFAHRVKFWDSIGL